MSKLLKNWGFLFASNVTQSVLNFFVFLLLARKLNPEGFGSLNALLALASIFSAFVVNSTANLVITREVTLHPKTTSSIFRLVFPLRMFSLLVTTIIMIFYYKHTGESRTVVIAGAALIVVSTVLWDLAESIAFGHFVTKITTFISIIASIIWLGMVILLPDIGLTFEVVVWMYAGVFMVRGIVYILWCYKKFIHKNREPSLISFKSLLLMSMPFLWMRVVGTFGDQIPLLILDQKIGTAEVGYYSVGNRLVMPIVLTVTTGLRAAFPFMTKLYQENKEKFNADIILSFSFVLIAGATIASGLSITSELWIPWLFGAEYDHSIDIFKYQAWSGAILCFDMVLSTVLSSTYRQKLLAIITTLDVVIIFPIIYVGIEYGGEGMALAKLIGVFIAIMMHIVLITKSMRINLFSKSLFLALLYFIILAVSSILLSTLPLKMMVFILMLSSYSLYKSSPLRELVGIVKTRLIRK